MTGQSLSKARIWLLAIRPKTLPASLSPVIVGIAFAKSYGKLNLLVSIAALVGALLLQILSNLANDYFDFLKGYDSEKRVGPTRVAASGLLSLDELRQGIIATVLGIILVGLYLVYSSRNISYVGYSGSLIVLAIGIFSLLCAILYSGGPFPLSAIGLGDAFVLLFFGLIAVNGTFFVNTGYFSFPVIVASLAPGLLITAILVVNNYRDYESDLIVGKKTLVVFFGKRFGQWEYNLSIVSAYLILLLLFLRYPRYDFTLLIPFVTFPFAYRLIHRMGTTAKGSDYNILLAQTAKLSLLFSITLSIGIII